MKEDQERSLVPAAMWECDEACSLEEGPHLALQAPRSQTVSLQNCMESLSAVYKSLGLWYFVTTSRTD